MSTNLNTGVTQGVKAAIHEGMGAAYLSLLTEWGKWARGGGVMGYGSGHVIEPFRISDEDARCIDRAVCRMRERQPKVYRIFALHYVGGLDTLDIEAFFNPGHKRRPYVRKAVIKAARSYGVDPAYLGAYSRLDDGAIRQVIQLGESLTLSILQGMAEGE